MARRVIGDEGLCAVNVLNLEEVRAVTACKICVLEIATIHNIFGQDLETVFSRNQEFKVTM